MTPFITIRRPPGGKAGWQLEPLGRIWCASGHSNKPARAELAPRVRDRLWMLRELSEARQLPYLGTDIACYFLPGPMLANGEATALFLGTTRINDGRDWDVEHDVKRRTAAFALLAFVEGAAFRPSWMTATATKCEVAAFSLTMGFRRFRMWLKVLAVWGETWS